MMTEETAVDRLFPFLDESSSLTVACHRADYSAGLIARAVEDCDAHLVNLNVTSDNFRDADPTDDTVVIELRVNHRDPSSIVRSLERYGFRVLATDSADDADDEAVRRRLDEFLRYLEV